MERLPFLKNLNGLRFLAASYVIGFHYFSFPDHPELTSFFTRGHIAVPFFFLLSGFILYYNYFQNDFNLTRYWKSRFIRLAPIYYLAMLSALPLLYINQRELNTSLFKKVSYFLSNLTLTQSLFINHDLLNFWNIHSWSLSVEMFLYLCSPFLIIFIKRLSINKLMIVHLLSLFFNTLVFIDLEQTLLTQTLVNNHFAPIYLLTFINGCILASFYLKKRKMIDKFSTYLFPLSILALLVSFTLKLPGTFYSTFNPFYQMFFSLLIISSCKTNKLNFWLGSSLLFLLGEASYAMYIFQAPVKLFTQQFLYKVLRVEINTGFLYCLFVFTSITLVSIIVSKYIDPVIRKKLREKIIS